MLLWSVSDGLEWKVYLVFPSYLTRVANQHFAATSLSLSPEGSFPLLDFPFVHCVLLVSSMSSCVTVTFTRTEGKSSQGFYRCQHHRFQRFLRRVRERTQLCCHSRCQSVFRQGNRLGARQWTRQWTRHTHVTCPIPSVNTDSFLAVNVF